MRTWAIGFVFILINDYQQSNKVYTSILDFSVSDSLSCCVKFDWEFLRDFTSLTRTLISALDFTSSS